MFDPAIRIKTELIDNDFDDVASATDTLPPDTVIKLENPDSSHDVASPLTATEHKLSSARTTANNDGIKDEVVETKLEFDPAAKSTKLPYKCSLCDFRSNKKITLKMHEYIHNFDSTESQISETEAPRKILSKKLPDNYDRQNDEVKGLWNEKPVERNEEEVKFSLRPYKIKLEPEEPKLNENKLVPITEPEAANITKPSVSVNITDITITEPDTVPFASKVLRTYGRTKFKKNFQIKSSKNEDEQCTKQSDSPSTCAQTSFSLNSGDNMKPEQHSSKPPEISNTRLNCQNTIFAHFVKLQNFSPVSPIQTPRSIVQVQNYPFQSALISNASFGNLQKGIEYTPNFTISTFPSEVKNSSIPPIFANEQCSVKPLVTAECARPPAVFANEQCSVKPLVTAECARPPPVTTDKSCNSSDNEHSLQSGDQYGVNENISIIPDIDEESAPVLPICNNGVGVKIKTEPPSNDDLNTNSVFQKSSDAIGLNIKMEPLSDSEDFQHDAGSSTQDGCETETPLTSFGISDKVYMLVENNSENQGDEINIENQEVLVENNPADKVNPAEPEGNKPSKHGKRKTPHTQKLCYELEFDDDGLYDGEAAKEIFKKNVKFRTINKRHGRPPLALRSRVCRYDYAVRNNLRTKPNINYKEPDEIEPEKEWLNMIYSDNEEDLELFDSEVTADPNVT